MDMQVREISVVPQGGGVLRCCLDWVLRRKWVLRSSDNMERPRNVRFTVTAVLRYGRCLSDLIWSLSPRSFGATMSVTNSLQQNRTYFSELFGRGWLLVGLFALLFYFLCFLCATRRITVSGAAVILETYCVASTLYLSKIIYDSFPRFYKAILSRMRLYSSVRKFLQWYLAFTICVPPLSLYVIIRYDFIVHTAFLNYSISPLIAGYGAALFTVFFIYTIISNIVARYRGVSCSKRQIQT